MPKKLLSPDAARDFLVRRFNNQHQNWLAGEGTWPLFISLGTPTQNDIAEDASAVREWASAWQSRTGPGEVVFEERQFTRLGRHRLPVGLTLPDAVAVAACVGQLQRWEVATQRYQQMLGRWPAMERRALASRFDVLADYSAAEFERLMALLAWLDANPASGLYLRQLPVEGVDTKWLEKRTGLMAGLLRSLREVAGDDGDFHRLFGLMRPAHRVRIRVLCPVLRRAVGGLCDIEAPAGELASLAISPETVVIVENLETGLALPDLPGTVAIMRLGNAVSVLGLLPWLHDAKVVYWGDIDTHGFAILDRARRAVPQLQSVLMDEATLLSHRPLWGQESTQCPNAPLDTLTAEERLVYDNLRAHTWGQCVRLEQERLGWAQAVEALALALAP
ncbi:MAG: Wadjet anti-phage system protein JetD domain-containing protein [Ottowia sp.]|uniref:Wadjet anti-phage system protein JetD domain-containing protein n=1 Tax=Ottowia sp. TaxID=1898956 RepID=UPI003C775F0B